MDQYEIQGAVGAAPAANREEDQISIIRMLEEIPASKGGADKPPLSQIVVVRDRVADPKLIAAITRFQRTQRFRIVDGRVDPNGTTWKALRQMSGLPATPAARRPRLIPEGPFEPKTEASAIDVYAVDQFVATDHAIKKSLTELLESLSAWERVLVVSSFRSLMVSLNVIVQPNQKIRKLVIIGHGSAGRQVLGGGLDKITSWDQVLMLRGLDPRFKQDRPDRIAGNVPVLLSGLKGRFRSDGSVLLAGCNVADSSREENVDGRILLSRTSEILGGVPVEGGDALNPYARKAAGKIWRGTPGRVVQVSSQSFPEPLLDAIADVARTEVSTVGPGGLILF